MAFKPMDRSKPRPEQNIYEIDDISLREKFKDKKLHRGTVDVTLDTRSHRLTETTVRAVRDGTAFYLVFNGQRAADFKESVLATLSARRHAMLDAKPSEELTAADFDAADAVSMPVIVEGFWKKRWWKKSDGSWSSSLELHVARFSYKPDSASSAVVEKGRIPAFAA